MLLDEDLEFMIRHSTLRILKHINYLVKFLMKCVRCLPVTTFILAETKITVKRNANPTIQEFKKKNEITITTYKPILT
jgi:hypothetical protein